MMINPRRETPAETMKELKVSIPVRYHLQLHTLKVLEGRQIHAVVQEALNGYFANMRAATADQSVKPGVSAKDIKL